MTNFEEIEKDEPDLLDNIDKNINSDIFEPKTLKAYLPQIFGSILAVFCHVLLGMVYAFSGILVTDIEKPESYIKATVAQSSFIAAASSLSLALTSTYAGHLTDKLGRLKTLRFSYLLHILGWIVIALASNITMLIFGRILNGLGGALSTISSAVFISETTSPKIRGTCLTATCLTSALGVQLVYQQGSIMSWKLVAWSGALYSLILLSATYLLFETPIWLVKQGHISKAKKSLKWLHKFHSQDKNEVLDLCDIHLTALKKKFNINKRTEDKKEKFTHFTFMLKPTVYKPLLIAIGLSFIQQFSGIYVITAYAIIFLENFMSDINPHLASKIIMGIPIFIAVINLYTMSKFGRKTLLLYSCGGLTVCLYISALYTGWIKEGSTEHKWVPVVMIFMYMAIATAGLEPVPWNLNSEIFPLENRGFLVGLACSIGVCLMFVAIYTYRTLDMFLGSSGIQYFYGTIALAGIGYVYFFVPETNGKTLHKIEEFFLPKTNIISLKQDSYNKYSAEIIVETI